MEEKKIDGRKTKTRSQETKSELIGNSGDQTTIAGDSRRDETQSERTTGKVGEGLVRDGVSRAAGGISSLLRGITQDFVTYLDAHGERLEARLIENKKAKSSILSQAAALENELAKLLEQAEKLPTDPDEQE